MASHMSQAEPETERAPFDAESCMESQEPPRKFLKVSVVSLSGKQREFEIAEADSVFTIRDQVNKEYGLNASSDIIKLAVGDEVLDDNAVLSKTVAKDGDALTLIVKPKIGIMEMFLGSIDDDTQWHRRHKFALRSESLEHEVDKIEVTVGRFRDQGWGGCQAELWIYLHDPSDNDAEIAKMKIFGPLRTDAYDARRHGSSPSCTIGAEEAVVNMARPGMVYKLRYKHGGGGGHSITVRDWSCKVFPQGRTVDDVTKNVSGTVKLENSSRLGPDVTTGLWELAEPPYPVEVVEGESVSAS